MENTKKQNWMWICLGLIVALAGIITTIIGYQQNKDGEITSEDKILFAGYFLVIIGILLLTNALIRCFARKKLQNYSASDRAKRLAYAALFAALAYIGFQYFRFDLTIG
ncbi:MAG: hypothetical protein K2O71_04685, partial [Lachnospiraceae bacterium]|nr:hypothetical protein [Lachnospiraceae bacterium]